MNAQSLSEKRDRRGARPGGTPGTLRSALTETSDGLSTDSDSDWLLPTATKDRQTLTADWRPAQAALIHGLVVHEVKHVVKGSGYLTEVFRRDWHTDELPVEQVFQMVLEPGGISAWHAHEHTTDRLFVNHGLVRLVVYDARQDSPTVGQ